MKILKIIIFFSIICFISACESETGAIENQFKNEAQNLIRILNKMQKIQSKKKVVKLRYCPDYRVLLFNPIPRSHEGRDTARQLLPCLFVPRNYA